MYNIEEIKNKVNNNMTGVISPYTYFTQVPNTFIRNKNIDINEKIIYIYLWGFGGDKYNAYPGLGRMEIELGITKKTILKFLNNLENKDGIYIINRVYENNPKQKATNLYYLSKIDNQTGNFIHGYLDIVKMIYPDKKCIIYKE